MNRPETYNEAVISNSSVMTDEISPIAIDDFQEIDNQTIINSTIKITEIKDNKSMDMATYKTTTEMREKLRKAMPDIEELKKLL